MGVSRPTVTRIYESARRKVAIAFSEARSIVIEGGNVFFDSNWFHCKNCKSHFNNPENHKKLICPVCDSKSVLPVNHAQNNLTT